MLSTQLRLSAILFQKFIDIYSSEWPDRREISVFRRFFFLGIPDSFHAALPCTFNTLYSYDENHIYGMEALAVYCRDSFGITTDEMQACYRKAGRIMTDRIGTDTAAIHSRMLRMQCMLELLEQPLFPHRYQKNDNVVSLPPLLRWCKVTFRG